MTSTIENPPLEKASVERTVHKWGCAVSEAVLAANFQHFTHPKIPGLIGYRIEDGCAVALGDPICQEEDKPRLAKAFADFCHSNNLPFVFVATTKPFADWTINHICKIMVEVGEELIFNPQIDHTQGHNAHKLRNKVHHAQKEGISVHEFFSQDTATKKAIENVGKAWLKAKKGPKIHLGELDLFDADTDRRWFYAKKGNRILACVLLTRLEAHQGWLIKFLTTVPKAPRGTSEWLISSVFESLRSEGCQYVTYGLVPSKRLGEVIGLGTILTALARGAFQIAKWVFRLNHRKLYWQQFRPSTEPNYVLFSNGRFLTQVKALLNALNMRL